MIKPEDVPDEVVEAAAWAACDDINGEGAWDETPFRHRPMWRSAARSTIAAAINAWPQRKDEWRDNITFDGKPIRYSVIILPLTTQENEQ